MKFTMFFLVLFFNTTFMFSQNEYKKSVDSLYVLINDADNNDIKINHYKALCNIYRKYNILKFNTCNEQLGKIAIKTKELGFYFVNKAKILSVKNDHSQSLVYARKAKEFFYKFKDWDNFIISSCDYAIYLNINDENAKAKNVLQNILNLAITRKSKNIAVVYFNFAIFYNNNSNYIEALQFAKKALLIEKNTNNIVAIYNLISHLHNSLGNYNKALTFNNLVTKNAIKTNQNLSFYEAKYTKSRILFDMHHYKEALQITIDNLKYYKKNNYLDKYYDCLYFVSRCYFKIEKYDLANLYIDKRIRIGFNRRAVEIDCKAVKAEILLAINDLKTARKYINNSLELLEENDYFEMKIGVYEIKQEIEEKLGDYKTALFYNKKIATIEDANTIAYNSNKLQQLEVELDVTEKNNRIKNLQIAQLKNKVEINSKNSYIIYISLAFIIALLSTIFYIINNKTIKKKNFIIENEKKLVNKSLQEKETLLKEIHHRVKNNMQLVMSLLSIQAQDESQNISDFMNVSRSRILSMALIHENLYQSESLSNVNFKSYTENLIQIIKNALNTNHSNIDIQIDINEVYLDVQIAIPLGLIINELVSNAYKYAFPDNRNGVIQIKLIQKKLNSELTISDNGIGIENIASKKKTLGIQLVEELVFQIDGKMTVTNKNGLEYRIRFENPTLKMNSYA